MGRWWQCRQGVGITRRPDCTPPPAPPEQGEAAPVSRATKGWIAWERTWAKPQICASTFARHDWTRWGTEGFLGLPVQPGQAQHTVPALILMVTGARYRATTLREPSARGRRRPGRVENPGMRDEPQKFVRPY